ncbi:MAG: hypothetical protein NT049_04085 [Planctomycetota bacterium]|nr:hypothetical protein [Planctomycetota bacterium]
MSAQASRPGIAARIGMHHGAPALFLDGRPAAALAYAALDLREDRIRQFAEAGIELFSFPATSDYDTYGLAAEAWPAPDRFDYTPFRERMQLLLRAAPQAKVLPRVAVGSPPWWDAAHGDQLVCGADGKVYDPDPPLHWPPGAAGKALPPKKMTAASFASQAWRADSGAALERFLVMAEEEFGDRIIGYHLCSGAWYAWCHWGTTEQVYPDTSPPQQDAFRRWLRRRGWAGVRDQEVPTLRERLRSEFGEFRDPSDRTAALAMEYSRFHSEVVVEAMAELVRRARGVVGPEKLLGASYGNFADFQRHPSAWHTSGHLAMGKFLAEADVNFVAGPTSAVDRRVASGASVPASLTGSLALRGKLWWSDNDLAAPLVLGSVDPQMVLARNADELRHIERREFGNVVCHGAGMAWLEGWGGRPEAPATAAADLAKMVEISRRALAADRSPAAEIAVVLDDESVHALRCGNRLTGPLVAEQLVALAHVGAPLAVVHVDDLGSVPPHKLYVLLNCFYATDERLRRIRHVTQAHGVTALWFYAPGLVGESLSAERMERLTGIRLALDLRAGPLKVVAAETEKGPGPFFAEYGTEELLAPVVYADDPDAEVLGRLVEARRPSTGRPPVERAGLVRKRVNGSTAVFSAAPAMPAGLLRQLAADAGVHIFTTGGESVCANRSLLAIAADPLTRPVVRLPQPGTIYELFSNKEVLLRSGEGRVPASPDGTWLFFRGTRRKWQALGK